MREEKEITPLRILHILTLNINSGVASFVVNLYKNIDRSQIQFDFITWNTNDVNNYISEVQELGARVYSITSYKKNFTSFRKEAYEIFSSHRFDGIHCHEYLASIPFLYWAKKTNIPIRIAHSHNPTIDGAFKNFLTLLCRKLFRKYATDFYACSKESGEFLFGKNSCTTIIPNGVEVSKFMYSEEKRAENRKKLKLKKEFVIGTIGRLEVQKNHLFLLEIFSELYKKEKNVKLLIVGDGSQRDILKDKVKFLDIDKNVDFLGICTDIPDLLQSMDLFILPSLYEGLGIVLVEAQSNGLPCIASDNIPKEVKINSNVQFLSLKLPQEVWVNAILKIMDEKIGREQESVSISKFNIKYSVDLLQKKYLNYKNEN